MASKRKAKIKLKKVLPGDLAALIKEDTIAGLARFLPLSSMALLNTLNEGQMKLLQEALAAIHAGALLAGRTGVDEVRRKEIMGEVGRSISVAAPGICPADPAAGCQLLLNTAAAAYACGFRSVLFEALPPS